MRLGRYLANSGLGTRREVKALIHQGLVKVDGIIVKTDSINIDENINKVYVNDEEVIYRQFYYVLLNKPKGYVSAVEDNVYPPVTDLASEYAFAKLFPVGRLDVDTTGTLLLTNNGDLCHKLLSPKYHVDKTYLVEVDFDLKDSLISSFEKGIMLDDELTLPAKLEIIDNRHAYLTIHQGKFHQVKRMFKEFGYTVINLDRVIFAFLNHNDLALGEYRVLKEDEINQLIELVNK